MARDQVTSKQHYVPAFYLRQFADNEIVEVLDVRARRLGKSRPASSVCYKKFFYGLETGVKGAVSQAGEEFCGLVEDRVADRFPSIIDEARGGKLAQEKMTLLASS